MTVAVAQPSGLTVVPELLDEERVALSRMIDQIETHAIGNRKRDAYVNREASLRKFGFSIPPPLRKLAPVLGWPAKAVTSLDSRLNVDGFVVPGMRTGDDRVNRIVEDNELLVETPQAHMTSIKHGCAFAMLSAGNTRLGEPAALISIRSASQATALWNRRLRRVAAGMSVIDWDDSGQPTIVVAYFATHVLTMTRLQAGWTVERVGHSLGVAPVVPLVHQPFVDREFGVPRVNRTVMNLTDMAARTMLRAETSGEFYSSPQRWALDLSPTQYDRLMAQGGWQAIMGGIFATERESDAMPDDRPPNIGQFTQASQQPHTEHLRTIATMFAGETAIPVGNLGIIHDNPASAEAITAQEAELVGLAERAQVVYGAAWAKILKLSVMITEGTSVVPEELRGLQTRWRDAATPTRTAQAQATAALVTAGVLAPHGAVTYEQLGYDPNTIERIRDDWNDSGPSDAQRLADALNRQTTPAVPAVPTVPAEQVTPTV